MPKFFTDKSLIGENRLEIKGEEALHIAEVLRIRPGEELTVGDGEGKDFLCRTVDVKKTAVVCDIIEEKKNENEPNVKITLFQALPKGDKMELVIQKCIEIGVVEIVPVDTRNSMVKIKGKEEKKLARWNKIALAAAKQCGRGIIPKVKPLMSFKEAIDYACNELDCTVMPYECERVRSIKDFASGFKGKSLGIFIGSEGGFDESEVNYAVSKNVSTLTMGKRILRTETAGLVASVIILYEAGDLS